MKNGEPTVMAIFTVIINDTPTKVHMLLNELEPQTVLGSIQTVVIDRYEGPNDEHIYVHPAKCDPDFENCCVGEILEWYSGNCSFDTEGLHRDGKRHYINIYGLKGNVTTNEEGKGLTLIPHKFNLNPENGNFIVVMGKLDEKKMASSGVKFQENPSHNASTRPPSKKATTKAAARKMKTVEEERESRETKRLGLKRYHQKNGGQPTRTVENAQTFLKRGGAGKA